jgi:hypothetical protein
LLSEDTGGGNIFSIIIDVCGICEKLKMRNENKMHALQYWVEYYMVQTL